MSERAYIASAAADLGDEYAQQITACIEILKTETDLQRRRVAESRYLRLRAEKDRKAA